MGSLIALPITVGLNLISARPSGILTFCKWIVSYIYIEICRWLTGRRFDLYDMNAHHDPEKVGFLPPQIEYDLESPQSESHLLHAADEVFFYGVNSSSECFITRIARSVNEEVEAWIYMKLKDGKIYRLKESCGYQNACSDPSREFTCGGLRIHYMKPMRRWRIFYNGILRETSEEDPNSNRMVHVKFALLWRASSDCFDMTTDVNSTALALAFSRSKWTSFTPPLKKLNDVLNLYAQSGSIDGTLQIGEDTTDRTIYLFGERVRFLGDTELEKGAEFVHILGQVKKTGSIVHIAEATIPDVVTNLRFGFVVLSNGLITPVTDPDMLMENISGENEEIKALFHADGLQFKLEGRPLDHQVHFESKKGWDGTLTIDELKLSLNALEGSGVLLKGKRFKSSPKKILKRTSTKVPKDIPFALHFSEGLCELSEITGGKGSSLGTLTHLSKEFQNFIVPNGIVVTTSAYQAFVSKELKEEIKSLEDVLYGRTDGDAKEACKRVMNVVTKTILPDSVQQAVVKCLQKAFGDKLHAKKFAIRSSATGEDTEQMSAAGQMDTYLGITGLTEIMSAVKKCWASQFDFVAVQYKRQNGQEINSPMAVVIQEMVSCDVAGVLFTCDPLTGNPTVMSITANYGLGESVVSGSEEPDAIILTRTAEDKLEIKEKTIGAKSRRIVVREDEGTSIEDVPENEKNACCVSDSMALRLGNIAIQIEKRYRSNRDIEWGFWNNNLYIFQSRPVTCGTGETDYEIDYETDGPLRVENDYFTVTNVGEVMPGAMSPLGQDIFFKYFAITFKRKTISADWQNEIRPNYFPKGLVPMTSHTMFYTVDLMEQVNEGRSTVEASMVGFFGRVIDDEELYETAMERYGRQKKLPAYIKYYRKFRTLATAEKRLERAKKSHANYHIPVEKMKDSKEVFDALVHACDDINEALVCHMLGSQGSSIWNMLVISILRNAKGGISSDVYLFFSKLLASINNVESADVPSAMQSLAYHIGKDFKPEEFKKMNSEEIVNYLQTSPTNAGIKFRDFLKKHGHRCLREFDIYSVTWGMNPKLLVDLLKNMVGNVSEDIAPKKLESFDEILSTFDAPLGFKERLMLKFILPKCRRYVQLREKTKSFMIKMLFDWRKGYRHLAKMLVSEGRIPDEDLMFFMNLEEIREMLTNRSPRIISRANHRRRRYPILDSYIFPELMKGFPVPVNLDNNPVMPTEDNFMMKGIPVSQGVAKGFARVALTLEEASHLKPGEILLTYSTDIGWTPYFPTLAGVVTEIGGLISHGAVVSREYGLPCIAGLHGVTRQFQTGDYVLLDGNKGFLQKISRPE